MCTLSLRFLRGYGLVGIESLCDPQKKMPPKKYIFQQIRVTGKSMEIHTENALEGNKSQDKDIAFTLLQRHLYPYTYIYIYRGDNGDAVSGEGRHLARGILESELGPSGVVGATSARRNASQRAGASLAGAPERSRDRGQEIEACRRNGCPH